MFKKKTCNKSYHRLADELIDFLNQWITNISKESLNKFATPMRALLNTNHQTTRERKMWKTWKKDGEGGREQEEKKRSKRNRGKIENGYRGGGKRKKERERGRAEQQRQHGPAVGARLYFNYTAGCEKARPISLFLSLSLFLLPPPVPPLVPSSSLCRRAVVHHRNAKK